MTVGPIAFAPLTAVDIVECPFHIASYHQVETAVVVIVHPRRAGCPPATCHSGFVSEVRESSVSIVVVKRTPAESSNKDVFESVVVVIADSDACRITLPRQPCFFGQVLE